MGTAAWRTETGARGRPAVAESRGARLRARLFRVGPLRVTSPLGLDDLDTAYQSFRETLKRIESSSGTSSKIGLELLCAMAYEYLGHGEAVLAESLFMEATTLAPNYAPASLGLARIFRRSGDEAAAIEQYQKVLRVDPSHPEAERELQQLLMSPSSREIFTSLMHFLLALLILVVALGRGGYHPWGNVSARAGRSRFPTWIVFDVLRRTSPEIRRRLIEQRRAWKRLPRRSRRDANVTILPPGSPAGDETDELDHNDHILLLGYPFKRTGARFNLCCCSRFGWAYRSCLFRLGCSRPSPPRHTPSVRKRRRSLPESLLSKQHPGALHPS